MKLHQAPKKSQEMKKSFYSRKLRNPLQNVLNWQLTSIFPFEKSHEVKTLSPPARFKNLKNIQSTGGLEGRVPLQNERRCEKLTVLPHFEV